MANQSTEKHKVVTFIAKENGQLRLVKNNPPKYAAVYIRHKYSDGTLVATGRAILPVDRIEPPKKAYLRLGVKPSADPSQNKSATDGEWDVENTCDWNCDDYCDCEAACESICGSACDCYCYCDCQDPNCTCDCVTDCGACYCDCAPPP
jgi:hypothetical protein